MIAGSAAPETGQTDAAAPAYTAPAVTQPMIAGSAAPETGQTDAAAPADTAPAVTQPMIAGSAAPETGQTDAAAPADTAPAVTQPMIAGSAAPETGQTDAAAPADTAPAVGDVPAAREREDVAETADIIKAKPPVVIQYLSDDTIVASQLSRKNGGAGPAAESTGTDRSGTNRRCRDRGASGRSILRRRTGGGRPGTGARVAFGPGRSDAAALCASCQRAYDQGSRPGLCAAGAEDRGVAPSGLSL